MSGIVSVGGRYRVKGDPGMGYNVNNRDTIFPSIGSVGAGAPGARFGTSKLLQQKGARLVQGIAGSATFGGNHPGKNTHASTTHTIRFYLSYS